MAKKVTRLFGQFQPKHYILELSPNRANMTFKGSVIIAGQKTDRPSKRLTMHQSGLNITSAHLTFHDKRGDHELKIKRINTHKNFQELRIHSSELLYPGQYTVSLNFNGKITAQMNGIYPSNFNYKGKDLQLIATQFESHHAREVFPCIDEPEAKATFDLSLTVPKSEAVISNTPIESQEIVDKNLIKVGFSTTPHMSTYLLAFVYGKLGFLEAKTKQGVAVRCYATPENVKYTEFALDVAIKCLDFYNDYFGIDYPLPKCDLIALPDFSSGAMENWGCVTFREQALLVDPKNTSLGNKQYVALVVAHELAHQWFGNLVTMRWWNDLWLNEGFASWIEYLAVDSLFPEWQMWTQFIVNEQQQGLKLDALEHTHSIEVAINHPDEIRTIFDAISYSKGASAIHMLHSFLGPQAFRIGLQYYLKKHAYANTDTVDLWAALEEASKKPVKQFMHKWTSAPGFPLVSAEVNAASISLSQKRFFINPKHSKLVDQNWPIPLKPNIAGVDELLNASRASYSHKDNHQFKLNSSQSGFYRVSYNSSHLERLGERLKTGHLEVEDRIGLLCDMLEAAKAGHQDTDDVLHFLDNFRSEDNYAVWDSIASVIGSLRLVMDDEELREQMKPFTRDLVSLQLKRLGWDRQQSDTHFDRLLRPIILGLAASADELLVIERCQELFKKIEYSEDVSSELRTTPSTTNIKRGADLDPDLRGIVFGTIARLGSAPEFNKLLKLHNAAKLSEEKVTLSAALTNFQQPELIDKALALIKSKDVRLQDVVYWIAYSLVNRHAKYQTWQWLQNNWQWLEKHLGTDLSFYRTPTFVARSFSDEMFLKEYRKFFISVMNPVLDRSYKQGIEMIEWQSAWKRRALAEVKTFFKSYNSSS